MAGEGETDGPTGAAASMSFTAVGHVVADFDDPGHTPIQARRAADTTARVEVYPPFRSGLIGLDGFDYAILLTHLDRSVPPRPDPESWLVVPFLLADRGTEVGVFATRHPSRPNPIGISLVRVVAVDADGFDFAGVDVVDATPVIDITPWVPAFDTPPEPPTSIRSGWYDEPVLGRPGTSPEELA